VVNRKQSTRSHAIDYDWIHFIYNVECKNCTFTINLKRGPRKSLSTNTQTNPNVKVWEFIGLKLHWVEWMDIWLGCFWHMTRMKSLIQNSKQARTTFKAEVSGLESCLASATHLEGLCRKHTEGEVRDLWRAVTVMATKSSSPRLNKDYKYSQLSAINAPPA
jgi:hypothetical protein